MKHFNLLMPLSIIIILLSGNLTGQEFILPDKYLTQPQDPVISEKALPFLMENSTGVLKIWVYFTDKGFFDNDSYLTNARQFQNTLSERAKNRRLRNHAEAISFRDLPVNQQYIKALETQGLKLRRVSKWMNAASFETTPARLEQIKDQPFIQKIVPVAGFKNNRPAEDSDKLDFNNDFLKGLSETSTLSYGASFSQLNQINVVAAHDSGFNGAGIVVAMFDTGFRKDHNAFAAIISEGRLIAEYDFINNDTETANEAEDVSSQWDHGTKTWSTLGGSYSGQLYGPAYGASFVLCKTEDVTSETPVEEDNWVAAVEWADSIGVDVISSSLGYSDWYTYEDYDGNTCTITNAADYAASVGILVCASAGNEGPAAGSITAPADADSVVSVGSVEATGYLSYFSSKGPTFDGRTKPEVCARGSGTYCASPSSTTAITTASGTSLSCPLVGGTAALVMQARPELTAMEIREALMMTASKSLTPDNAYGWGIIDAISAIYYNYVPPFLQGDANYDGAFNISDAVYIINYVFIGGNPPLPVLEAGDANNDGEVNVTDAVFLINFIFLGTDPPPGYQP